MSKKEKSEPEAKNHFSDQDLKEAKYSNSDFHFISLAEARQLGDKICEKYQRAFELLRDK